MSKVLRKLAIQSIAKNRKRSILTVVGITLSTALILAVAGMVSSVRAGMVSYIKATYGSYHAYYYEMQGKDLSIIKNHIQVEEAEFAEALGYAVLEGCRNEDKPYLYVMAMPRTMMDNLSFVPYEGRVPENDSELMISSHIIGNGGVPMKVGDRITLSVGRRSTKEGSPLDQSNPWQGSENEMLTDTVEKTYTVVGIMNRAVHWVESYSSPGYLVVTYRSTEDIQALSGSSQAYFATVRFRDVSHAAETAEALRHNLTKYAGMVLNQRLIWNEGGIGDSNMMTIQMLAFFVMIIILTTSVFVIRNSFAISVSEKTRQYGILSSVGATSRQIRGSILYEGLVLGAMGEALGILLGVLAVKILTLISGILLKDSLDGMVLPFEISPLAYVVSILVSGLTIYLSSKIPAVAAGRISPLEAIRGNRDIRISDEKKSGKGQRDGAFRLIHRIFGIGGVVALNNLRRSRKKYRTTVVSLVLSISVFIPLSWFTRSLMDAVTQVYHNASYNLTIYSGWTTMANSKEGSAGTVTAKYRKIMEKLSLEDSSFSISTNMSCNVEEWGSKYAKETFMDENGEGALITRLLIFNREYFAKYAASLGIRQDPSQVVILCDEDMVVAGGKRKIHHYFDAGEGDSIPFTIPVKGDVVKKAFVVTRVTTERPMGYEGAFLGGGALVVSEDYFGDDPEDIKTAGSVMPMHIRAENADELEERFVIMKSETDGFGSIYIANLDRETESEKNLVLLLDIFLYGFITVITLIGVTNIFNTITTNMILRGREFAMLRSVGMTDREFHRMIWLESMLYGMKSLCIGVPVGALVSYILYRIFSESFDMGYRFPLGAVLLAAAFVFAIVWMTMHYSLGKINRQNMIEQIRSEAV